MNKNQYKIISHIMIDIDPETVVNEEYIKEKIDLFSQWFPVSDEQKEEIIASLHSKLAIRMDMGACIKKEHIPWYYSAKKDISTKFWDRYTQYLIKDAGFPPQVINALDRSTDEMMDMLGNPRVETDYQRRGLVVGDVQSGKTATYTALANKAADAGYRIVFILTGTIEKLRKQTQARLDEGFVGLDSTAFIRDKNNVFVGVGNIDASADCWSLTSTTSDFNKSTAEKLSGRLSGINSPVLFVLKKNKSVLEKLEQWLRVYNTNVYNNKCPLPMLLIDDEADNASVNTRGNEDPTAINANIRKLLRLFSKANYVGFTATPYANIFIDPESNQEMLDDDLFPRDFIYALDAPTNYVGARNIFSDNGEHSFMLKENDDCEDYLPEKHKKDFVPQDLPDSLKMAIASFFIANVVRDLRGQTNKHRSMLINISRFVAVQDNIAKGVDGYVRELQREIKNYYLTGAEALKYDSFSEIKSVYENDFKNHIDNPYDWSTIQENLHKAIASIVVKTVNGGNASKNLNYDEYQDDGLRLIAVGGFSLSRGLTLEGLCTSYFYRNSKMYDTLMQMGRWFGYRDGYTDLCRIWMGEGAVSWYRYISTASDELRREVKRMQLQNKTPREFGLCVRSDIAALMVTARNKMITAKDYELAITLNGKVVETPYLHMDKECLSKNLQLTENLVRTLLDNGFSFEKTGEYSIDNPLFKNIPRNYICDFLTGYKSHYLNMDFLTENLVKLINDYKDGTADEWDLLIATGKGSKGKIYNQEVNYVQRNFGVKNDSRALQMSDRSSRLGDKNLAKGGLTREEVSEIEQLSINQSGAHQRTFSQETYFNSGIRRNPLLIIYPVELRPEEPKNESDKQISIRKTEIANELEAPLIGLSIGIPRIDGRENVFFKYKINLIKYKEIFEIDDDFEEIDETIQEEDPVNA
jgi:hypothetical protein